MPKIDNYAELNELITRETGNPIVTKWMVLGEALDDEGDRCLFYLTSDGMAVWDELGIMDSHSEVRKGQMKKWRHGEG